MLRFFKKIISKKRYGFPKYKKNVWYNNGIWSKGQYPIVFDENKKYIECQKGLNVQMGVTKCGKKVFYKITDIYKTKGGDFLYPSDAINCNMVFSHVS